MMGCVTDPLNRNRGSRAVKLKDSKMEALSQPMISAEPPECCEELVVRLDTMRGNESFCDVKVVVKDKEFAAHKAVLAVASPFFLSLLISGMRGA